MINGLGLWWNHLCNYLIYPIDNNNLSHWLEWMGLTVIGEDRTYHQTDVSCNSTTTPPTTIEWGWDWIQGCGGVNTIAVKTLSCQYNNWRRREEEGENRSSSSREGKPQIGLRRRKHIDKTPSNQSTNKARNSEGVSGPEITTHPAATYVAMDGYKWFSWQPPTTGPLTIFGFQALSQLNREMRGRGGFFCEPGKRHLVYV